MNKRIDKILKSTLKRKVKLTHSLLVIFLITGSIGYAIENENTNNLAPINITINNYGEQTGLELGDNSRARGVGSISTGRNGVAIGKNAVATGENETKETIERKLEENKQRLQEIADAKKEIADKAEELRLKQIRERETIEAGIRVEEIQKSKEKARLAWEDKKQELVTKTEESKEFFREHQAKIDTLNSKLRGLENLTGADFSSEEGLSRTADLLKAKVEDGTQLNLSHDFYLDYVKSYYKALGDLRENNLFKAQNYNSYGLNNSNIVDSENTGLKHLNLDFNHNTNDIIIPISEASYYSNSSTNQSIFSVYSKKNEFSSTSYSDTIYGGDSRYYNLGVYELGKFDIDSKNIHRRFLNSRNYPNSIYEVKNKKINTFLNINTDITSEQEFNDWNSVKDEWKERIKSYNTKLGDELIGKLDTLTGGKSTILYNMVTDMKFELVDLDKQITYYQGQYEKTKDVSWLDKKKKALDTRAERIANNETRLKEKARELGYALNSGRELDEVLGHPYWDKWVKENVTDIMEKNKLTTNKLTSELEQALGINKNAILAKERELTDLRNEIDQAKRNYEGLNPTESDMILAREYQRVKEEINRLTTDLKNAETRKDNLEKALTLHNLKNVGENQIAFGTDTLAVGNNSIAMGYKAITVGTDSVNIGARGQATGTSITQLGQDLVTNGNNNISIGNTNVINGENNIVFGRNNNVGALGDTNKSNGNIILGSGITVSKDITNSITLGDNSTPISNAISVGSANNERQIKNVKNATDNQDAVTYKQLKDYVANNSSNVDTSNLANKDFSNLNDTDKTSARTNLNVYSKEEVNKKELHLTPGTYVVKDGAVKLTQADGEGTKKSEITIRGIVDTKTLETKLGGKVNTSDLAEYIKKDGSNITTEEERKALATNLTNGASLETPKDILITDTIAKAELDKKVNNSDLTDTLITGKITKGNVTSETLEITNGNGRVIGNTDLKVELKDKSITKDHLSEALKNEINGKASTSDLENLAKKDLSNVEKTTIIDKVATGNLDTPTGALVTDTKIKEKLDLKSNKDLSNLTENDKSTARTNLNVYSKDEIDNKIGNVTPKTEGDVISDTLKITNGTDRLIGNTDLKIDIENKSITKEKLSTDLTKNIDNKANINGDNIISDRDKEDFRNNINVYNKNEIDSKINNISTQTNLDGEVKENEEKGVKGKVIDKHLKENYVHKSDIANRDKIIISNYTEIQENKKAIENNAREIKRVDAKINKVAALSQATASLDWGQISVGNVGVGASIAQYSNETGIAVGVAYRPTDNFFMNMKWTGLAGEPHYNSIGASATYQFNFK